MTEPQPNSPADMDAIAAVKMLEELLQPTYRVAVVTIQSRIFVSAGIRYRCGGGPWRSTVGEAILAAVERG
jgi:hypothetical protein